MKADSSIKPSQSLKHVRYEIRGALARRAMELERQGYEIISLNIGNPGAYGFRTPEILRLALVQNLIASEGYAYQKGVYPAREAILLQQQNRGVHGGSTETRSEEHTSELQSRENLVCRLLLEKKNRRA